MNGNIISLLLLLSVFTYSLSMPLDKSEESNSSSSSSSSSSEESKDELEKPLNTEKPSEYSTSTTQSLYSDQNIPDIKKRHSVETNAHQGSPSDPIAISSSDGPLNSNKRQEHTGNSENSELSDSQNTNKQTSTNGKEKADTADNEQTSTEIIEDNSSKETTKITDLNLIVVSSTQQPGDVYGENLKKITELTRVIRDTNNQLSTPLSSDLNDSYPVQSGNSVIQNKNNNDVPLKLVAASEVSTIARPDHRNLREASSETSSTTEEPDEVKIVKLNGSPPYPSSQQ